MSDDKNGAADQDPADQVGPYPDMDLSIPGHPDKTCDKRGCQVCGPG